MKSRLGPKTAPTLATKYKKCKKEKNSFGQKSQIMKPKVYFSA